MKNKLTVSQEQLNQFRRILNKDNTPSSDNYRDINPINNRTLYNCEYQIISDQTSKLETVLYSENNNKNTLAKEHILLIACGGAIIVACIMTCLWYICKKRDDNKPETTTIKDYDGSKQTNNYHRSPVPSMSLNTPNISQQKPLNTPNMTPQQLPMSAVGIPSDITITPHIIPIKQQNIVINPE